VALTPKQARFVTEYVKDLNATQAAIRAGYKADNADVTGPRLLGNVGIADAIAARQKPIAERAELTVASHLAELEALRDMAKQAGQLGPAITAEMKRGEIAGFYVKRREDVSRLTPAERADRAAKILKLA
jgi:phage terminase small subunit